MSNKEDPSKGCPAAPPLSSFTIQSILGSGTTASEGGREANAKQAASAWPSRKRSLSVSSEDEEPDENWKHPACFCPDSHGPKETCHKHQPISFTCLSAARLQGGEREALRPRFPGLRGQTKGRGGPAGGRCQEEDAHRLLAQPGLPAGVHLRHEALPEQLRAGLPGLQLAVDRDPGEDLVSEPQEQMEAAALGGAGGGQHGPRLGPDSRGDAAGFQRQFPAPSARAQIHRLPGSLVLSGQQSVSLTSLQSLQQDRLLKLPGRGRERDQPQPPRRTPLITAFSLPPPPRLLSIEKEKCASCIVKKYTMCIHYCYYYILILLLFIFNLWESSLGWFGYFLGWRGECDSHSTLLVLVSALSRHKLSFRLGTEFEIKPITLQPQSIFQKRGKARAPERRAALPPRAGRKGRGARRTSARPFSGLFFQALTRFFRLEYDIRGKLKKLKGIFEICTYF